MNEIISFPVERSAGMFWRHRVDPAAAELRRLAPKARLAFIARHTRAIRNHLSDEGLYHSDIEEQIAQFTAAVSRKFNGIGVQPDRQEIADQNFADAHRILDDPPGAA